MIQIHPGPRRAEFLAPGYAIEIIFFDRDQLFHTWNQGIGAQFCRPVIGQLDMKKPGVRSRLHGRIEFVMYLIDKENG
jgi:hypothetical protein